MKEYIRRYFVISHQEEAKIIFWTIFKNPESMIFRLSGHVLLSCKEILEPEAETLEAICDLDMVYLDDVGEWIDKKRYLTGTLQKGIWLLKDRTLVAYV